MGIKIVVTNRKAFHDFTISDKFEAGIELKGTEVKAIRAGKANLTDGWVDISTGEAVLRDVHISPYSHGNQMNHPETRPRRLLLHHHEIAKLSQKIQAKGLTVLPLKIYFKDSLIKVEIGVGRGKQHHDKRESEKKRSAQRDMDRAMR